MKKKVEQVDRVDIKFYLMGDSGLEVARRLERISTETGLSVSKVVGMAVRYGLPEVEQRILNDNEQKTKAKK